MEKIKTDGLSKLLYVTVIIGLVAMSGAMVTLPWFTEFIFRGSTFYELISHEKLVILLYITGVPAWLILWMTKNLARNIMKRDPFSVSSRQSLKVISICSFVICGCYLFTCLFVQSTLGVIVVTIGAFVVALIASILYRLVQLAIEIKEENELTI